MQRSVGAVCATTIGFFAFLANVANLLALSPAYAVKRGRANVVDFPQTSKLQYELLTESPLNVLRKSKSTTGGRRTDSTYRRQVRALLRELAQMGGGSTTARLQALILDVLNGPDGQKRSGTSISSRLLDMLTGPELAELMEEALHHEHTTASELAVLKALSAFRTGIELRGRTRRLNGFSDHTFLSTIDATQNGHLTDSYIAFLLRSISGAVKDWYNPDPGERAQVKNLFTRLDEQISEDTAFEPFSLFDREDMRDLIALIKERLTPEVGSRRKEIKPIQNRVERCLLAAGCDPSLDREP